MTRQRRKDSNLHSRSARPSWVDDQRADPLARLTLGGQAQDRNLHGLTLRVVVI
ncbi:hypothetical protein [Nodosilinea sp. LEGE 07298]|uniref:hypothetical protein n=1 Tax=Nodosilinea sp. LEGE 07298 TaxID=2777970 RepID=UPI001D157D56|nr:hypothetical protein [Nodosilinea sp. LEGE 07298]